MCIVCSTIVGTDRCMLWTCTYINQPPSCIWPYMHLLCYHTTCVAVVICAHALPMDHTCILASTHAHLKFYGPNPDHCALSMKWFTLICSVPGISKSRLQVACKEFNRDASRITAKLRWLSTECHDFWQPTRSVLFIVSRLKISWMCSYVPPPSLSVGFHNNVW